MTLNHVKLEHLDSHHIKPIILYYCYGLQKFNQSLLKTECCFFQKLSISDKSKILPVKKREKKSKITLR